MARIGKYEIIEKHRDKILDMAKNGYIDTEICKKIGISHPTFYKFLKKNPEFKDAFHFAKIKSDIEVENAAYKNVMGYEYVEEHLEYVPENGKTTVKSVKKIRKHVPGNPIMQIFWLKNRCHDRWSDRQRVEHSGEIINKIELIPAEQFLLLQEKNKNEVKADFEVKGE